MRKNKTKVFALCAMFAAMTAILSQISIPIGPVPINLAHISTFIAAGLLGAKYGALSQIIFVFMGAVGLPVFSGFMGGMGRVLGPTGGYIVAYILCAFVAGFIIDSLGKSTKVLIASIYAGWIVVYAFGTAWYAFITHTSFVAALMVCVVPFLIGDALKTILCVFLIKRLSPLLCKERTAEPFSSAQ